MEEIKESLSKLEILIPNSLKRELKSEAALRGATLQAVAVARLLGLSHPQNKDKGTLSNVNT